MKSVLAIFNINAGRKQAIKYKKKIHKFLLKNAENYKIISIEELKSVNINDYDTVVVMGGDGTVNKIVPYIINSDRILGIIPCGTANLLAQKLKIPSNLNKSLELLKNGNETLIDIMKVNNFYSALRLGLGYDSDIICKTPQSLKNKFGYLAYFIAGIIFGTRLKNKEYTLKVEDKTINITASCIIAANAANMYRNLISVSSDSKLNDGLLDVFILKTTNPFIFFFEFLNIIFKYYKNTSRAEYFKTKSLIISNKWMNVHIDGEKRHFQENINITILKSSIKVISSI